MIKDFKPDARKLQICFSILQAYNLRQTLYMFTAKNLAAILLLLTLTNCGDSTSNSTTETTVATETVRAPDTTTPAQPDAPEDLKLPAPGNSTFKLALASEGLQSINAENGSARMLAFNLDKRQVVTAVSNVLQTSYKDSSVNSECGGLTILTWPNGLSLNFDKVPGKPNAELRFVGWSLGIASHLKPNLFTMAGVGIGSTLKEIEAAYKVKKNKTTLGTEVSLGNITALLAKDAPNERVTNMWNGTNCIFR